MKLLSNWSKESYDVSKQVTQHAMQQVAHPVV